MPEIRYSREYDNQGNVIRQVPYEVSDEEFEDEVESAQVQQILKILGQDWTAAQAINYLKLLIKRLLRKGIIP